MGVALSSPGRSADPTGALAVAVPSAADRIAGGMDDLPVPAAVIARRLGLREARLIEAARHGEIPFVRLPSQGTVLFYVSDLVRWCQDHHRVAVPLR